MLWLKNNYVITTNMLQKNENKLFLYVMFCFLQYHRNKNNFVDVEH